MNRYKLGVGPMSHSIINCINEYTDIPHNLLMVVASRNQVDYKDAYVCTAKELADVVINPRVLLCRDHCGPYFKDSDEGLSIEDAIIECKKTIDADIKAGFDLIHIDVSRIIDDQYKYAAELIEYVLDSNPHMMIEFGSEINTGTDLESSMQRINEQLEFVAQYAPVFFVTQTGSLTRHTQVGTFDVDSNKLMANRIHQNGSWFKEHNADYLTKEDIALRRLAGVDSVNIAPQLGAAQTTLLKELADNNKEWQAFAAVVEAGMKWKKWVANDNTDEELHVIVAGHYHFSSDEYKDLINSINRNVFDIRLNEIMFKIFNTYIKD